MKAASIRLRPAPSGRIAGRALIPLDTRRIREEALEAYRKAEGELARISAQLKRYHERDLPGFQAWCRRTFGKLFLQLKDLESSLHVKQAMARDIRHLAERFDLTEAEAYGKYLWRRDNPAAAEEEDRRQEAEERRREADAMAARRKRRDEAEADDAEAEDEPDPDDDPGDVEELFASFLGAARRRRAPMREADALTARELYRAIVRRLHPDHHGHMNEPRKHLWDEAQTAWRLRDVETLQNVLAQCETEDVTLGATTAVSAILLATRRVRDALRQSKRQLRALTARLEWNYSLRKANPAYARKVQTVILDEIRLIRFQLDRLTRALEALEKEAGKRKVKRKITKRSDR